jgi:hypothetical protein
MPPNAIGSAMSLFKKCAANDHLPASQNMSRRSFWPAAQAGEAPSGSKPDRSRTDKLAFRDDFTLEHSLSGRQIAPTEISGSFGSTAGPYAQRVKNTISEAMRNIGTTKR